MKLCYFTTAGFLMASIVDGQAADRPNVLFLFADDWGRHASAYAAVDGTGTVNDAVSTPNFDKSK